MSERTGAKWLARYRGEGRDGLVDRSSAPRRIPRRTPAERVRAIEPLRRLRMTAAEIAEIAADAALDCLGDPEADRAGQTLAAGAARAAQPLRVRTARASSSTSTSRSSPASLGLATASSAAAVAATRRAPATSTSTSASTTTAGSPTSSCSHDERAHTAICFLRRALAWFTAQGSVPSE